MNMLGAANETMALAREVLTKTPDEKLPISFSLSHLEDMLHVMNTPGMSKAKMGRWLGWMQAAVVAGASMNGHRGYISLVTIGEINKRHKKGA